MTTRTPALESPTRTGGTSRSTGPNNGSALHLRMDFTEPRLAVLTVAGDVDTATTPQLADLLWPRLITKLTTLVVDLREVRFLGLAGVELLSRAHSYARHRGINFCLINSTSTVDRALTATGADAAIPHFSTVAEARGSSPGQQGTTVDTSVRLPQHRLPTT